MTDSQFV